MSYRNMLLVSVEEYQNLRKQLLYNQAPALTQDLYKVKEIASTLPIDQQNALEGEVLREHINQNKVDATPSLPIHQPIDDSIVVGHLNNFNRINKTRANQIYQHLKAYNMQWNSMGQLLDDDNTPIANSNIVELIDYITNNARSSRLPAGFQQFISLLESSQLPRHYLSTKGETRITDYKHLQSDDSEPDGHQLTTSPSIGTWKRLKRLQK